MLSILTKLGHWYLDSQTWILLVVNECLKSKHGPMVLLKGIKLDL